MKRILIALVFVFLAGTVIAADFTSVSGTYTSKKDGKEYLSLHSDGTFLLRQRKYPPNVETPFEELSGKYELDGDKITFNLSNGGQGSGKLQANTFEDGQGVKWVKEGTEAPQPVKRAMPLGRHGSGTPYGQ